MTRKTDNINKTKIEETSKMLEETLKFINDYKNNIIKKHPTNLNIPENEMPPQAF
jgi:hypothetical protein|tara:strand:- start:969 stop:1133 length:165 start_codon:yes stop_codon:yes gene_type:complete